MRKKIIPTVVILPLLIMGGYLSIRTLLPLDLPSIPTSTIILDTDGREIGELVYSGSIRHREIPYDEIPEFYRDSLVTMEDRSFWINDGWSPRAIVRSTIRNIEAGRIVEWASTLSSQLIRNTLWIDKERTFSRKLYESLAAIRLNGKYSKEEILTMYTNRVSFGYMNYGLASASEYYFGKSPKNLTQAEQISLLAIPKNPKRYDPYKNRKNLDERIRLIVRTLEAWGKITPGQSRSILAEHLSFRIDHTPRAPYVVDFVKKSIDGNILTALTPHPNPLLEGEGTKSANSPLLLGEGLGVRWVSKNELLTTLDLAMTERIDSIARAALSDLSWRNVSDYGIIIAERTGKNPKLRVMIGGVNYRESTAGQVNSTLALRQPGSTIKPFTYALAFRDLWLTPSSTILDLPVGYKTSEDYAYEPKNYSRSYRGEVSLAEALSQSINIPAVKLAERVRIDNLLSFLRSAGITSLSEDANHYGLALTLWDGEVSLYELLQAYTVFANDGTWCPIVFQESVIARNDSDAAILEEKTIKDRHAPLAMTNTCHPLLDRKYTDMIAEILTDRYAKIESYPIGSPLDFPDRRVFVKTGTSRNFRDNWAVGFTDQYMIGVWTGNKNAENMKGVSGATGAGELFSRIVYALEPIETEQKPQLRETKQEKYLEITNPLSGSVYSLDPLKSPDRQQIELRYSTNIEHSVHSWVLDEKVLTGSFVTPLIGSHMLELILLRDGAIVSRQTSKWEVR